MILFNWQKMPHSSWRGGFNCQRSPVAHLTTEICASIGRVLSVSGLWSIDGSQSCRCRGEVPLAPQTLPHCAQEHGIYRISSLFTPPLLNKRRNMHFTSFLISFTCLNGKTELTFPGRSFMLYRLVLRVADDVFSLPKSNKIPFNLWIWVLRPYRSSGS
jgi:hypothetical protein